MATDHEEPEVVSKSISCVSGTEPDMDDIGLFPEFRDGPYLMVHVDGIDWSLQDEHPEEDLPMIELRDGDLIDYGVDHSTTFEIEITIAGFYLRILTGRCRELRWDREFHDDGTVTMTFTVQPAERQINSDVQSLEEWPEGEDDQATREVNENVSFSVHAFEDHPEDFKTRMDGIVAASNAQISGTPSLITDDGEEWLHITLAAPHYTVDGEENDGFYYAILPPPLLDSWDVSEPEELTVLYEGDAGTFYADELDDSILISLPDVTYSVVTIDIKPDTEGDSDTGVVGTPPPDTTNGDDDQTPTPPPGGDNGSDGTPTPGSGNGGGDPAATPSPADDTDGTPIPGFGPLAALGGIGGAAYLLRRHRSDEDE